jgi:hypothetical protein
VVSDGTTVVPLTVAMQVFWQFKDCELQPDRQVADEPLGVTGVTLGVVVVVSAAWARRIGRSRAAAGPISAN